MSCRRKIRKSEIMEERFEKVMEIIRVTFVIVAIFVVIAFVHIVREGGSEAPTARIKGGIQTENIITEEIQVEEIQVEEIQIRTIEDSMRTIK